MTSDRKEPHLSGFDPTDPRERIPTLSDRAAPDLFADWEDNAGEAPHQPDELHKTLADALKDDTEQTPRIDDYDFVEELTQPEDAAPQTQMQVPDPEPAPAAPGISAEDIEALSDRVLDQVAPALREAVTAAVTDLLAARLRGER